MIKSVNGKILILSDVHYPYCDEKEVKKIVEKEKPQLLVLLGDIIVKEGVEYRNFLKELKAEEVVYIKGDEDVIEGDTEYLDVVNGNRKFVFFHGHQILSESAQYSLAKILKKVNYYLPPLGFCTLARMFRRNFSDYFILGHSHVLVNFRKLKCVNSGTLSLVRNLYNDRGYVKVVDGRVEIVRL